MQPTLSGELADVRCTECGEWKPRWAFSPNNAKHRRSGIQSYCRLCGLARRRRTRGVHPDDARLEAPAGQRCEICSGDGGDRGLFLDHNHETGRFRGWLCLGCNTAIARLADSEAHLMAAIAYLDRSRH